MKQYDVFPSEGGWRYAGAIWAGGPIIDQSPWFASEKAARAASQRARSVSRYKGSYFPGHPARKNARCPIT